MDYIHKKEILVKYQVNKFKLSEEFSLLITIVIEPFFAGKERKTCLYFSFLFFFLPGPKGFFSCTILLLYNSKIHPEHPGLLKILAKLSSFPMVSPEDVSCLYFLS